MSMSTEISPQFIGNAGSPTPVFTTSPLTSRCADLATRRTHACVGISPFNGYFHARRIADLAHWALDTFEAVHFFVPDSLATHTLEAIGYPSERAAWKARRQGQHVHNKITTALAVLGIPTPDEHVLTSSALAAHPRYEELHAQVRSLFDLDPDFREACLEAAEWVLDHRLPPGTTPTLLQLRTASTYLLGELPLFLDTPGIAGVQESVFCYHQTPQFLRRLFERRLACTPLPGQGFLQVTPAPPS